MTKQLDLTMKPTGYSYRVDLNVWAGEYPVWDWDDSIGRQQIQLFTAFGINNFIDLTESGEMPPYAQFLSLSIERHQLPIPNGGTPAAVEDVVELFRTIECSLLEKPFAKFYIHCLGGVGRTGTIVACYYVYFKQMNAEEALAKMRHMFSCHERANWMSAPETEAQIDFIHTFANTIHNN
jgi:hypothetical protein